MNQAQRILNDHDLEPIIEIKELPSHGINTMMLLLGVFEHSLCCYFALGARGKPAEQVATEATEAFLGFLNSNGVFDEYSADQLLLPLCLAKGTSQFATPRITQHLITNARVIQKFFGANISVEGKLGKEGLVRIDGVDYPARGH